jgi:hypothetical protein
VVRVCPSSRAIPTVIGSESKKPPSPVQDEDSMVKTRAKKISCKITIVYGFAADFAIYLPNLYPI